MAVDYWEKKTGWLSERKSTVIAGNLVELNFGKIIGKLSAFSITNIMCILIHELGAGCQN